MNQDVTDYIEALEVPWQAYYCARLRDVVHLVAPDIQERIQYKKPHFLKNGKYAAAITTSKDAVSFTIFNTNELAFPEGFDGPPERKTIKLRDGQPVDYDLLSALLRLASDPL
ncbi:DUF1801 domain-containing protein [Cohnella silvisoli]|uniref:DUF1801 domain-containing protein n=1 Tax=Cohnella silvisoli TaxID=2873699 RepID=A0ABV1L206_9BACL|nr:DUF1801 domain-containing protein [Cohnella silvisoli]MCD9025725.1 DUF1801 domain-containing protein [Cohnella silvisoli]